MRGKVWNIWLGVVALGVAAGLFVWSRQTTPEDVAKTLFDMNLPTRLAFVADSGAARLAGVDVTDGAQVVLDLQGRARHMALDKVRGVLAYAGGGEQVFLHHLTAHTGQGVILPHSARELLFDAESGDLWVRGEQALSVLDARGVLRHTLKRFGRLHGVHLNQVARQVVVLDEGAVWQLSLAGEVLQRHALPAGWTGFTPSALSADGGFLLFGVYDMRKNQHLGVVWQADGRFQTYALSAPLLRPLADNGSQWLFFVDENGQGLRVNARDLQQGRPFETVRNARRMALGWLDAQLLVVGEGEMVLHDVRSFAGEKTMTLPGKVNDVFVMADSKTVLLTVQGSKGLFFVDMREGGLREVALEGIAQPDAIAMGATYTLCH